LAGHETSAVALVWAFVLLSKHPAVRTKLQLELDTVLAGRTPSVEDLPQLPYLDWVFKEVLRLYPSAYNIGRVSKAACHIGGYPIGRGRNVIMCQWAVHRSQRYYEQPAQFIPERWQPAQASQRPKFAYFPFGAGPRNCIGAQFATLEAKLILAVVWQCFTLELSPDAQVGVDAALTLRPTHRLPMRLRRRPVNGRMA
jgi:cytochrome P450